MLHTFVLLIFIFTALLLIGVVLIQQPKSAGGGLFAGTGQSLLGTSGKTFWTKFTIILACLFMFLCLLLSYLSGHQTEQGSSAVDLIEKQQQQAMPQQAAPPPAPANAQQAPGKPSNPVPQAAPGGSKPAPSLPSGAPKN